jgi:nucleoside-diphosphate-sugar epimerase
VFLVTGGMSLLGRALVQRLNEMYPFATIRILDTSRKNVSIISVCEIKKRNTC